MSNPIPLSLESLTRTALSHLITEANNTAKAKGWHDQPREAGTLIALMHSELSEALEYLRNGNPPSDHIPEFRGVDEELADVIIRIFDFAAALGPTCDLPGAIIAKMAYNKTRPQRHGGKAF